MIDIFEKIDGETIDDEYFEWLLEADPSRKNIESYLKKGDIYIAKTKGQSLGIIVLLPKDTTTMEIVNLSVAPAFRAKGIGTALIRKAMTLAKEQGYETMEIGTGSTSFQQLYLYQKCGFRMMSIDRDFFVKHYDQPITENGLELKDMVRLNQRL